MAAHATAPESELTLIVAEKRQVATDTSEIVLHSADGSPLPRWTPGAHIDVIVSDALTRQYSLSGDPANDAEWRITVLRETESRGGSSYLCDEVSVGDSLDVRGARNHFELVSSPRYVFVAGGIGITPLLPMLAAAEAAGAEWSLLYVGRSRATMAYAEDLVTRYPDSVQLFPRDETDRPDLAALLATVQPETLIYTCGPNSLLDAVVAAASHWPAEAVHLEHFVPKELTEPVLSTAFEVELASSGVVLTVQPDQSILDAVRASGKRVLSSCAEGTCGTCETTILEGTADHRDSILTPAEQAANETMMICVSRASCPRLVLDL